MKPYFKFWPIFLGLLFASSHLQAEEKLNFFYLKSGLSELNASNKLVGLQILGEELSRHTHKETRIEGINSFDDFISSIERNEINFALLNVGDYLNHYKKLKPYLATDTYAIKRTDELYEEYVILVKKSSDIDSLNDLNLKRLALSTDHILYDEYLKYIIKQTSGKNVKQFLKTLHKSPTPSQSILDVFFGSTDACLVAKHIYNLNSAMNPAIVQDLKIIHSSGPMFIPAVLVVFAITPPEIRTQFSQAIIEDQVTARGKQMLELFKVSSVTPVSIEQFQPMLKMYQ
ncbi:PhnD/SsuA/transferrin family substrate-binding protein [Methylomonas sp. AM2-LC]|uniref:PhnD/SsuA/transferrin family substrate-binding protein n=1 Tax=Methylomonas sp. AM2-LC TaxID=3153301 RepID=UPI0032673C98